MHSNFCNNLKCLSCFGMVASTSLYISTKWVFVFFYLFTKSNLLGFLVFFLKVICFQTLSYLFFYFFL